MPWCSSRVPEPARGIRKPAQPSGRRGLPSARDDHDSCSAFVLTPLTYLGGIFYSIKMLPPFWQHVSQLNPILYMINAFRYGFIGVSDINVTTAFLIILGFVAALFWFALSLLNRGVGIKA